MTGGLDRDTPLPPLRDELRFMPAADDAGQAPGWLIHDPLRNSYFRITHVAGKALSCWRAGTVGALLDELAARHDLHASLDDIGELMRFVLANGLVAARPGAWEGVYIQALQGRKSIFSRVIHGYLFFRIPLVRPQGFLRAALPYVRWLGTWKGIVPLIIISLTGLYLTGRQWDVFFSTFMGFLSLEGLLLYGLTLIVVKAGHELGHAFIATRFGCRVPVMGVAFLVMFPMLYTDVTDAWKLRSRRQRLLIDAGGMLVELGIAGVALFLWAFLPEGPGRTAAFFVATTSLAGTLLINMSPFMRFDGYHILADATRMHNLAPRAFAHALWWLRRLLLGLEEEPPERVSRRLGRFLIAYSLATWVYRLFLFLGIALLVYHAFPKVIGIALAAVEVGWFIVLPVWRVILEWWKMRDKVRREGRPWRLAVVAGVLVVFLFMPVWSSVRLPAVMKAAAQMDIYPPEAAQVEQVLIYPGKKVRPGDVLVVLHSRELEQQERQAREKLRIVELRLARLAADRRDLSEHDVLLRRKAALQRELAGLARRREGLLLKAETGGTVRRVLEGLRPGMWVNEETLLGRVIGDGQRVVSALMDEEDSGRLDKGAAAVFVPDDPLLSRMELVLEETGAPLREGRDLSYLSSVHGGPVAAERDDKGRIRTRKGMLPVLFRPADGAVEGACEKACTGVVTAAGRRESLAGRMARRVVAVLLRESGF